MDEPAVTVLGAVAVSLGPDESTVVLTGDIDLAMESALGEACSAVLERGVPVRIDARGATFIDSRGVAALLPLIRGRAGGRRPVFVGAPRLVLDIIVMMGLGDLLELA
jgi:anti-anti-sigma factor